MPYHHIVVDPVRIGSGKRYKCKLAEHSAKWHKACQLHFYPRELERVAARKKQKLAVECEQPAELVFAGSPVKRRSLTPKSGQQHMHF